MRVLYLVHRVPYAPNRGDRMRSYHTLRYLRDEGIPVHAIAFAHDAEEAAHAADLRGLVASYDVLRLPRMRNMCRAPLALGGARPLTHVLLDSHQMAQAIARCRRSFQPDCVLAYCSGMARFAMEPALSDLPFVLDMVDVDSLKWESLAEETAWPRSWIYRREARVLRPFEVDATRAAAATLVVSERERKALRRLDAGLDAVVLPNGVDVERYRNRGEAAVRAEVVFTGVFSYEPNEHAAIWLMDEVWPLVLAHQPDAHLTLVGASPTERLRRVASRHHVEVTGTVADVRPYLWRASVAVAPLFTARGVQNKVLEAVAAGLPCVITSAVAAGLPEVVRPWCKAADDPAAFADAVSASLGSIEPGRVPQSGLESLAWEACLAELPHILKRAVAG